MHYKEETEDKAFNLLITEVGDEKAKYHKKNNTLLWRTALKTFDIIYLNKRYSK